MPTSSALSILQISDLHILPHVRQTLLGIETEHYFQRVLEHAFSLNIKFDLTLVTGDLTQNPCISSYQRIFASLDKVSTPCICLPGNHDNYAMMQQVFNTEKISCLKQLIFPAWQLICLNSQLKDSPDGYISEQELDFLEKCLSTQPTRYALIATHHNCLASGSAWLDTMQIKNSSVLLERIAKYPQAKALVHGHIHQGMDCMVNNLRILATPSTCFQFKPNSIDFAVVQTAPGYRILQLFADGSIETKIVRLPEQLTQIEFSNNGY